MGTALKRRVTCSQHAPGDFSATAGSLEALRPLPCNLTYCGLPLRANAHFVTRYLPAHQLLVALSENQELAACQGETC